MKKFLLLILLLPVISHSQWILDSTGMGNVGVLSIIAEGNNIFAGTHGNGVYFSNDTGAGWLHTNLNSENIWSLAVNGMDIFAAADNNMGVYKSTNIGGNWTQALNGQTVWSLLVNGAFIFAGTENNGVFISSNGGLSWSQTALNIHSVHSLAAAGNNIFAGTFGNGVYLSTDNGVSWNQTSLVSNLTVNALSVSGIYIYAGTQTSGVYLSTNNGTNWTQTSLNSQYVRTIIANGRYIFAGVQAGGVFISYDYGESWLQRNEGLENASVDALILFNNYILAGTEDGAVNGFYKRPLTELIGIQQISEQIPEHFSLFQNYPNPFNPVTKIRFEIPNKGLQPLVQIKIFDILGREVSTLVNEKLTPGTYEVSFDAGSFASGIYFYKLMADDFSDTKKMVLIK